MNHKLTLAFLMFIISPLFFAFHRPVANEKYIIDKKESVMTWKCDMVFAGKGGHNGYISLSKGELMIEKDQLAGGAVEVDMNTMADENHGTDSGLIEHLKSPDFFDVNKFPSSSFAITKVALAVKDSVKVTGNLTIKGITHEITFPAKVDVKSGVLNANGKVIIDRAQYDVRYGSGKFFFNLADEAISDFIELDLKIVARKNP